jgi:hypothetical protein
MRQFFQLQAKDDYLAACLKDWRNCNKPADEVTGYDDRIDPENDAATFGIRSAHISI